MTEGDRKRILEFQPLCSLRKLFTPHQSKSSLMGKSSKMLLARSPCHNYLKMSEGPSLDNRVADEFKNIYYL